MRVFVCVRVYVFVSVCVCVCVNSGLSGIWQVGELSNFVSAQQRKNDSPCNNILGIGY